MPKLDAFTSGIEGWETMSAEQRLAALSEIDFPEKIDLTAYIPKATFDKTASELAAAKKSLKDKMSSEDAAQQQYAEELRNAQERAASSEKELAIMKHTAKFMELGYAPDLAKNAAEALHSGDTEKLFEIQRKFQNGQEQKFRSEQEKGLFPGGSGKGEKTDPNIELAKRIAKTKSESQKAAETSLKYYL